MRIQGNVEVSIRVQNGKMVKVTASSPSPRWQACQPAGSTGIGNSSRR